MPEYICPECGEPVRNVPPARWPGANSWRPEWSHFDSEPLCPVVGPHGYEPTEPVLRES